ncbi:hypothetical protein D9M70_514720 [compost metagenome]
MRPLERDHIGDQPVLIVQPLVLLGGHGRLGVPAERFQGLFYEVIGVLFVQTAVALESRDQLPGAGGEYLALGQNAGGQFAQLGVVDQLQAQQRGEHPERADLQRVFVHRAEGGGVDWHPRAAEVVVAHRLHAHDGEQAADGREFLGRTHPDGAVPLHRQALDLACPAQSFDEFRRLGHLLFVDIRDELQQGAVERDLRLVHVGHGTGELCANVVRTHEPLHLHGAAISFGSTNRLDSPGQ